MIVQCDASALRSNGESLRSYLMTKQHLLKSLKEKTHTALTNRRSNCQAGLLPKSISLELSTEEAGMLLALIRHSATFQAIQLSGMVLEKSSTESTTVSTISTNSGQSKSCQVMRSPDHVDESGLSMLVQIVGGTENVRGQS